MSLSDGMAEIVAASQRAHDRYVVALHAFQLACQRSDFKEAEAERLTVIAALEAYLDSLAAAYREIAERRG